MPTLVAALGGFSAKSLEEFRLAARHMTFRTALEQPQVPALVTLRANIARLLTTPVFIPRLQPKPLIQRASFETTLQSKN
jgi:hypothetical protein